MKLKYTPGGGGIFFLIIITNITCFFNINYRLLSISKLKHLKSYVFLQEVEESKFLEIERISIHAEEYGVEILGHIRVPLYNYMNRRGKPVGLAQFLQQRFAGNGRDQLLACLQAKHILTSEEISAALSQDVSG